MLFAGSFTVLLSHIHAGLASSLLHMGPGPLAQGMTPPTMVWALLHQLAMGTSPTHLILAIAPLKLSSQITPGCVRSTVKGNKAHGFQTPVPTLSK